MNFIRVSFIILILSGLVYAEQEVEKNDSAGFNEFLKDETKRIKEEKLPTSNIYEQAKNAPEEVPQEAAEVFKLEKLRDEAKVRKKVEQDKEEDYAPKDLKGVTCFSATNQEYLGNINGYFCGGNWTYPIYIPKQAHIKSVTLELDIIYRTDFLETAIFEDQNPLKVKSRQRNSYAKTSAITLVSKKYNSLHDYIANLHEIVKDENPKVYRGLHEEHKDALIEYFSSNYRLKPIIKSVVFDAQSPVFSSPIGHISEEDDIYSSGRAATYGANPKFLGLLSSEAETNFINFNYSSEYIEEAPIIRSWFVSELADQGQGQICHQEFFDKSIWQQKFKIENPVKSTLQILDYEKDYSENGMQLVSALAYCITENSPEINSLIQADKWEELYRKYKWLDCDFGDAPSYRSKDYEAAHPEVIVAENENLDEYGQKLQVKQELLDRAFFGDEMGNLKEVDPQDVVSEVLFEDKLGDIQLGEKRPDMIEKTIQEDYDPSTRPKPIGTDIPDGFYDNPNTPKKETGPKEAQSSKRRKI